VIRVLVADDEPLIRAGIRTVLESAADIEVVAQADNGRAAIDEAIRHRADVALIDIKMPALDGLDAIELLRRQAPAPLRETTMDYSRRRVRRASIDAR
jgi:YesN/AraC family two-component response regulator